MPRVRILEQAAQEAIEAAAWYENECRGLGIEFDHAVSSAISLLEDSIVPLVNMPGATGAHGAKRIVLKRFPYDIVIRESPEEIIIVAIAHHSRRPGYWRRRLRTY